jgi:predicted transcriptional regulator
MKISSLISECIESGNTTNDELVECIQLLSDYLCLVTPKEYAKSKGIKFQSVYKGKKPITILGRKFVINNE